MKYNLEGIKATLKVSVLFSFFKRNLATRYRDTQQKILNCKIFRAQKKKKIIFPIEIIKKKIEKKD